MAVSIAAQPAASNFEGIAEGYIVVTVVSDSRVSFFCFV